MLALMIKKTVITTKLLNTIYYPTKFSKACWIQDVS